MATSDELALAMRAGQMAQRLNWSSPTLVSPRALSKQTPTGDPLIVIVSDELTLDQAQQIAALSGAGREVAVIASTTPPADVGAWLPPHVLDPSVAPPLVAATSNGPSVDSAAPNGPETPHETRVEEVVEPTVHRIKFKVSTSGVYGSITFLSPNSYDEIRRDFQVQGKDFGATEAHSHDCDQCGQDRPQKHPAYDCYDSEIFHHLYRTTPCLLDDLTFMGFGLSLADDHPNLWLAGG